MNNTIITKITSISIIINQIQQLKQDFDTRLIKCSFVFFKTSTFFSAFKLSSSKTLLSDFIIRFAKIEFSLIALTDFYFSFASLSWFVFSSSISLLVSEASALIVLGPLSMLFLNNCSLIKLS